jgi:hypothetical protein
MALVIVSGQGSSGSRVYSIPQRDIDTATAISSLQALNTLSSLTLTTTSYVRIFARSEDLWIPASLYSLPSPSDVTEAKLSSPLSNGHHYYEPRPDREK